MKKILYSILFFSSVLLVMSSCVKDDKDLFKDSAPQRLAIAQTEALLALQGAENGWVVQYFTDPAQFGGFTMLMKFGVDMHVQIAGESAIAGKVDNGQHPSEDSMYRMIGDQGPVLSLETSNKIFHQFADPGAPGGGNSGEGMLGDYEFLVLSVSPDKIVMKGKKRKAHIVFTRLSQSETWDSYLDKIDKVAQEFANASPLKWTMFVDSKSGNQDTVQISTDKYRVMKMVRSFIHDETTTTNPSLIGTKDTENLTSTFIMTPEGMRMYEPFGLGKDTINTFVWEADKETMKASNATMEPIKMNFVEFFTISEDVWLVDTLDMPTAFKDTYRAAQKAISDFFGKPLYWLYFTYEPTVYKTPVCIFNVGGETAFLLMTYTVSGEDNLKINRQDKIYSQLAYDCLNVREFNSLISYLCKQRCLLTTDNPLNPSLIDFSETRGSKNRLFTLKRVGAGNLFDIYKE